MLLMTGQLWAGQYRQPGYDEMIYIERQRERERESKRQEEVRERRERERERGRGMMY